MVLGISVESNGGDYMPLTKEEVERICREALRRTRAQLLRDLTFWRNRYTRIRRHREYLHNQYERNRISYTAWVEADRDNEKQMALNRKVQDCIQKVLKVQR